MADSRVNLAVVIEMIRGVEADYLENRKSRRDVDFLIKKVREELKDEMLNNPISIFSFEEIACVYMILERMKKMFVFENRILQIIEVETDSCLNVFSHYGMDELPFDCYENILNPYATTLTRESLSQERDPMYLRQAKLKRSNYPKRISRILQSWLKNNLTNPYPTESEKAMLIKSTGLTATQINNWFINARRRTLPYLKGQFRKND